MLNLNFFILLVLIALTSGCATAPEQLPPPLPEQTKARPAQPKPAASVAPPRAAAAPAPPPAPVAVALTEQQVHELVLKLLPPTLKDKEGWGADLQSAFKALQVPPSPENFCAVIAVTEQESSFQADPIVPGLPAIVRREIEQRRTKYSIPQTVTDWMLSTKSRDGHTYQQRIDALKTEKELSDLIEEIIAMVPAGKDLYPNYNPVHTGGPMQVSVEFAEAHARARPYPYPIKGNLRNEVFTRRGGLYFGSAILLDYRAPYNDMLYRFADFNSGRYSSRNAAFQRALAVVSGKSLVPDGDLLRYKNGAIDPEPSSTLNALLAIRALLKMSETDIRRDLQLEKLSTFSQTALYLHLYALADQKAIQQRVALPEIDLKSPKISRKLTTHWFADRVNGRYKSCLQRVAATEKPAAKAKRGERK